MEKSTIIHSAVTCVVLLLTTFTTSMAQQSHVAILLNTVNSSLNYGDMNSSLKGYKKDLRGVQAGLSWQAGLTNNFSIVTEAYFVKKGGKLKADNPLNGVESTLKLYTVEVPVLVRVHTGKFYFNAGPSGNYIFSGKKSSETEASHSISFGNGQDSFRKWEAGMQAGAGYQFSLKKARMAVDLRYTHGMTSISKTDELYNRTINLSLVVLRSW